MEIVEESSAIANVPLPLALPVPPPLPLLPPGLLAILEPEDVPPPPPQLTLTTQAVTTASRKDIRIYRIFRKGKTKCRVYSASDH
jgi:hypothetical protein